MSLPALINMCISYIELALLHIVIDMLNVVVLL